MGLEGEISWCPGSKSTRKETSETRSLPPSTCCRLLPLESGQMGGFIACTTGFEGEPSPDNLNQPVWHPGFSLSFVTKNTCVSSSCEVLSRLWTLPCRRGWERRGWASGGQNPWARSSCPHVGAPVLVRKLSGRTLGSLHSGSSPPELAWGTATRSGRRKPARADGWGRCGVSLCLLQGWSCLSHFRVLASWSPEVW